MKEFKAAIDIHAAPDRVWAIMSDVEHWHEWTPSVSSIVLLDQGPLRVGSRARVRQPKLMPAVWQVTELNEGREFTWETRSPGVHVVARHIVEADPGGCRASLLLQFSGFLAPLIVWLTRRLNERYLRLETEGLKARSEAQAALGSRLSA